MSSREKTAYTTDVIKVQISDKGKRCSFGSSFPKKDDYPKIYFFMSAENLFSTKKNESNLILIHFFWFFFKFT
jgi:hypothetical protein